ncbi:hypothetical protein AOC05_01515 [Arthrobacter alpinus]|uniref:Uncharacterized protein n=1 Tax=Arthrobacter alpinus TaxID=656366 RepID=A0A0M3UFH1_9MICC|nr:hypothetical protein [Arthrobacter alpinus]ALE91335.1 hypothetical protein AOC05_01515 [Arthrobacter alpinus]
MYFYLELVAMAKLISRSTDRCAAGSRWAATAEDWLSLGRTEQWAFLVKSWLLSDRLAAGAGADSPAHGALVPWCLGALVPDVTQPGLAALRRACLQALASAGHQLAGQAFASTPDQVQQYFSWTQHRRS